MTVFHPIKYQLNILASENVKNHYMQFEQHHLGDSGIDLYHDENIIVESFKIGTVDFEIQCEMIDLELNTFSSYYLVPRSSISKTNFQLANSIGVIDAGYRGNIMAKIRNFDPIHNSILLKGTYFQIIAPDLKPIKIKLVNELSSTTRDDGCFGSTNKDLINKDLINNSIYNLYFDGCSKGNPGKGGAGAIIYDDKQNVIWSGCIYLGDYITNNCAEYNALIFGMKEAINYNIKNLIIKGDSQLIIRQMNGEYKVKSNIELYKSATSLKEKFNEIKFEHVYRIENSVADKLANDAII